uniref:ATP synthase F0 subunit 8 n=1 Tax=Channa punctata TaxID=304456 RepID=UPI0010C32092|nr:ATP synthase F0 subunit 8 [Channa punctata]QBS14431.1 ATP synthase F0 subunit 8 [Channa punctata]WPS67128.1 ATP synthase F0 subunit 8 [Channa punctata]
MPQLNPAPWLAILLFSWFIFLAIIPQKISVYLFPNNPTPQSTRTTDMTPWNWPWQ